MNRVEPPFADRLTHWQRQHGRHDLPWQVRDPYRVWLSEVMLQQTQVATVIPYFLDFVRRFPDVASLAAASLDEVLAAWSGLGYYSRARNLHRAAQMVMSRWGGEFPRAPEGLAELPGVGRSTAAAIAVFAFDAQAAILDGNVRRVLARWAGIEGWPGEKRIENLLWTLAESLLPSAQVPRYTQGLMDLGSLVCTRGKPDCPVCPLGADCQARLSSRQTELPTPRPRKLLLERQTVLLLLRDEHGRCLLERRPPAGIWGGLWSLPEVPDTLSAQTVCLSRYGLEAQFDSVLPEIRHTFSHFSLAMTPLEGYVFGGEVVADQVTAWVSATDLAGLGIPAPVRRLLQAKM